MDKPAQNIQDSFLNAARKERLPITIFLLSGVKLTGRIRSFDKYCLILESGSQEQMIFKHAISTVGMQRAPLRDGDRHFSAHPTHPPTAPATHESAAAGPVAAAAASDSE